MLDKLIDSQPHAVLGASDHTFRAKTPVFIQNSLPERLCPRSQVHPDWPGRRVMHEEAVGIPITAPERNYPDANHKPEPFMRRDLFTD